MGYRYASDKHYPNTLLEGISQGAIEGEITKGTKTLGIIGGAITSAILTQAKVEQYLTMNLPQYLTDNHNLMEYGALGVSLLLGGLIGEYVGNALGRYLDDNEVTEELYRRRKTLESKIGVKNPDGSVTVNAENLPSSITRV